MNRVAEQARARSACRSRSPSSPSATGTRSSSAAATTASPRRRTWRGPASRARARAPRAARRRLHPGAPVLRRPLRRQPLRLRRRPARRARDRRARPARARPALLGRRPQPLGPVRRRHAPSASGSTTPRPRRPRADGRLEEGHRRLLGLRGALRRGAASCCARAPATPGSATRPTPRRDRGAARRLAGDDRPRLRGLDRRRARRLPRRTSASRPRSSGRGSSAPGAGPYEPGTASIKLMHYQGDLDGQGPRLGLRRGRHGDGQLRDRRRRRARHGAVLACGVPVSEIIPGRGRHARGRHRAPRRAP